MLRAKCSLKLHVKLHQQWRTVANNEQRRPASNQGIPLTYLRPREESNFRPAV